MKILFTGPESTGKSTHSEWLAEQLSAPWIEEVARDYLKDKRIYHLKDLVEISKLQEEAENSSDSTRVCDTGAYVLNIWAQERFNLVPHEIEGYLKRSDYHIIFLCAPDIPWEEDPLREHRLERDRLFESYQSLLRKEGNDFVILEGRQEEKRKTILDTLKKKGAL